MSFSLLATTAMTGSLTAALLSPVYGLPSGGQVVGGQASINTVGSQTTITQTTNRGIINWHGFDIAHGEQVHFQQPSTSSVTLNRVTGGGGASQIMGQLSATGTVMLVNPNGVLFGPNAQVNVGSLVATSSDIADDRFMAGDYRFDMPGKSDAAIINQGNISVADAGLVAFVAPNAVNDGIIQAKLGKVQLASGDRFTLDLYGDGLVSLEAGPEITSQLVSNSGTISADGGRVFLTAAAAHDMVNSVINMDGIIQAASIGEVNGEIVIFAEGSNAVTGNDPAKKGQKQGNSTVLVSGTLNASGRNHGELGGTIEVLADRVGILSGALLDASGDAGGGTIHVGGDYLGTGDTPTALRTVVQSETLIQANATGSGNGGRVIVWSDERTDFAGRIEARGGELGGDGGFVETSGKQILNATGLVDASSPWGLAGLWLLDPNNVTIQSSGSDTNVTGNPDFTTTNDSAIVTTSSIQTALNAGTNVTVTTGTAGTDAQDGNITINSSINKTAGGEATLTLRAHNNITVSSGVNIISISDRLHLVLNSDIDGSQSGSISLLGTGTITTNGGNIIMGGGADPSTNAAYGNSTQVSGVFIQKAMHAGGGNIALRGIGWADNPTNSLGVRVGVVSTVGSGNITLVGSGGGTQIGGNGGNGVQVSGAVTAVDGVIQIIGDASSSLGNGNFAVLISNSVSTTGAGSIQVEGTGGGTTHTNYGVLVRGASASISAQGSGSVSVAGVGGTGSGNGNQGVRIANGGTITSVDGTLTVEGTGGGTGTGTHNSGVVIVDTGSAIRTTGSGNIAVTGIRGGGDTASNYGLNVSPANGIQSTGSGSIAINADTLLLASANNINSVSNLTIAPYTAGTTVGIGTGTGTLSLSNTFLGYLNWGSDKLLTFGDVNTGGMNINTSGVFTKPVALETASAGDIFLNSTLSSPVASGTSLVLASGKNFINNAGAAALDPGSGRWLVYSTSPANDTLGGLTSDATVYSATFSGYPPASVSESGNVFLYSSASPSGTVTITALDQFIVYGTAPDSTAVLGTTFSFSCSDGCSSSVITAGPAFAFTGGSGTGGSGNYNAGSWTITPSGVTVNNGYTINYLTGTLTVTPLAITVDGVTAVGKVYDGTTAATLSTGSASLSGVVAGDTVNLGTGSATGSFADKNVGTGKAVAASGFAISGADSGNYTLDQPAGLTADITAKQLTASVTADNKVYDGTTATTGSVGSLNGIIAGDTVNLTGTDSYDFADKNVGSGKTVMVSGLSLDGADAGNYILAALTGTADITAKLLSILGVTASNKVYDGSTAASLDTGSASLAGVVGGDTVGLETGSVSGSFADKNVGTGKAVAASGFA
ncbi:MAG TPA: YDG domain-containing protein, partial [Gemmatales bacterium]|nr:YDG domain-containing protein [Gemmatales bacterium]